MLCLREPVLVSELNTLFLGISGHREVLCVCDLMGVWFHVFYLFLLWRPHPTLLPNIPHNLMHGPPTWSAVWDETLRSTVSHPVHGTLCFIMCYIHPPKCILF